MTSYNECIYWNTHVESYGTAVRIKKGIIQLAIVMLCLITFGTNWLIPFVKHIIKKDLVIRYNG